MAYQTLCRSSEGTVDELAALEEGSGTDKSGETACVYGPPPGPDGLDKLEARRRGGGTTASATGDLGARVDGVDIPEGKLELRPDIRLSLLEKERNRELLTETLTRFRDRWESRNSS
ncbi:hypothetical protein ACF1FC_17580 [Streptomyces sp. NPDC014344]|uniref:hypothetical protein n=1 Tax=Streptomyces sp. NPDC014344 TaxID=3364871 RepID=UPI0037011987